MSDWVTYRLGDNCAIDTGYPFESGSFSDDPNDIKLLRGDNLAPGRLRWHNAKRWPRTAPNHDNHLLRPGDVVLAMDRPWIGAGLKRAVIRAEDIPALLVQRVARLRTSDATRLHQGYLAAIVSSQGFSDYLVAVQTGTAVPHISVRQIRQFPVRLPPLSEQQAIAEILGALDDKIAANTRLAATATEVLEIEAEARWFRRDAPTVPLTDYVDVSPRTRKPSSDEPTYVDMKALPEQGMSVTSWTTRRPKGGARFMNGDTLVARITPCLENRKTGFVDFLDDDEIGIGSTEFIVLRTRPGVAPPIGYLLAVGPGFRNFAIQHMVGSSGRQRVAASDITQFELPAPDDRWLHGFGARATATFDFLRSTSAENRTLAATRDALLPQLMSGKVRVRDIETIAGDAGA